MGIINFVKRMLGIPIQKPPTPIKPPKEIPPTPPPEKE
jgi:hypothetical protein